MDFWGWVILIVVALLVGGFWQARIDSARKSQAQSYADKVKNLPDFDPNDIYVSVKNYLGIAIDVDRHDIILIDGSKRRRFKFSSIISCEILQDDLQLAYANRGSQIAGVAIGGVLLGGVGAVIGGLSGSKRNVKRVKRIVLRFVTDDFDKPNHDILLLESDTNKGVSTDSGAYEEALKVGELWHSRVRAIMKAG